MWKGLPPMMRAHCCLLTLPFLCPTSSQACACHLPMDRWQEADWHRNTQSGHWLKHSSHRKQTGLWSTLCLLIMCQDYVGCQLHAMDRATGSVAGGAGQSLGSELCLGLPGVDTETSHCLSQTGGRTANQSQNTFSRALIILTCWIFCLRVETLRVFLRCSG